MPESQRDATPPSEAGGAEIGGDLVENDATTVQEDRDHRGRADKGESRKRRRLNQDNPRTSSNPTLNPSANLTSAACDQCRIRKVRCDRRQPECSNCRKSGTACTKTGGFKRVNQAKELRDDFSTVLSRLDEIDETLMRLTKQFTEHSHPSASSGSLSSHRHVGGRAHSSIIPLETPSALPESAELRSTGPSLASDSSQNDPLQPRVDHPGGPRPSVEDEFLIEKIELENGARRAYRNPAVISLLKSVSRRLIDGCRTADLGINEKGRAAILRQLERFPLQGKCIQPTVHSDRQPVASPPQLFVRLFIHGFIRNINVRIPIFDEKRLRNAVDAFYSSTPPLTRPADGHARDGLWAIIFNNISLLELGLDTRASRRRRTFADTSSPSNTSLLAQDLISSCLRNCDRALADLTPYTRPSLLNIQALLTLALVAQEFYSSTFFERVLHAACYLARVLGLHLAKAYDGSPDEDPNEQDRVFRVLYSMDKQRAFITGDPCDLYHFDSSLKLWEVKPYETQSPSQKFIDSLNDMMIIWEEIYLKLYSAQAIAAGTAYLSSQVPGLIQQLIKWREHHPDVLETIAFHSSSANNPARSGVQHGVGGQGTDDFSFLQLEVRYCYHVTHVLILRCDSTKNEQLEAEMRRHARTCLELIVEIGCIDDITSPTPNHHAKTRLALLARVVGAYPMVAFADLVLFCLDDILASHSPNNDLTSNKHNNIEADVKLLNSVSRLLQVLQYPDRRTTYNSKVGVGLEWAVQVLDTAKKVRQVDAQTGDPTIIGLSGPAMDPRTVIFDGGDGNIATDLPDPGREHTSQTLEPTTAGGYGFYMLDNWNDFLIQDHPDPAQGEIIHF